MLGKAVLEEVPHGLLDRNPPTALHEATKKFGSFPVRSLPRRTRCVLDGGSQLDRTGFENSVWHDDQLKTLLSQQSLDSQIVSGKVYVVGGQDMDE